MYHIITPNIDGADYNYEYTIYNNDIQLLPIHLAFRHLNSDEVRHLNSDEDIIENFINTYFKYAKTYKDMNDYKDTIKSVNKNLLYHAIKYRISAKNFKLICDKLIEFHNTTEEKKGETKTEGQKKTVKKLVNVNIYSDLLLIAAEHTINPEIIDQIKKFVEGISGEINFEIPSKQENKEI